MNPKSPFLFVILLINCILHIVLADEGLKCTDSDEGVDIYEPGRATVGTSSQGDWCQSENEINEVFCTKEGEFDTQLLKCPSSAQYCIAGACTNNNEGCKETDDGMDPLNLGTAYPKHISDHPGNTDYCQATSTGNPLESCVGNDCSLREFYCIKNSIYSSNVDIPCPNGCKNGMCKGYIEKTHSPSEKKTMPEEPSKKKFTVYRGWNLINFNNLRELPENELFGNLYLFNPLTKKYVFYDKNNMEEIAQWDDETAKIYGSDEVVLIINSIWYYSQVKKEVYAVDLSETEELLEWIKYYPHKNFIIKGWNLFNINEAMVGKRLVDMKGSCTIQRAYMFDPTTQTWGSSRSEGFENEGLENSMIGYGFALKVENECRLDFSGSYSVPSAPPSIPT